ncbi:MAG TPA: hypothetical protein PKV20_10020 [Anaerolineae bacterium]|nr:hypothetical protein [Anaerolineae bacterium]
MRSSFHSAASRQPARLAGAQRGTLAGCHPPASTRGGSGKIAALCYHPT